MAEGYGFLIFRIVGVLAIGVMTNTVIGIIIAVCLVFGIIGDFLEERYTRNKIKENIGKPDRLYNVLAILNNVEKKEFHNFIITQLAKINELEKINLICQKCFKTRNPLLIKLIVKKNWIASEPAQVKIYTILKNNQLNLIENSDGEEVKYLLDSLKDQDPEIVSRAKKSLEEIRIINQHGIDYLCQEWLLKERDKFLELIIVKHKYQVKDSKDKSLFYFLTEQWDKYEKIDFDQTFLKSILNSSSSQLKEKIINNIKKSGRSDWLSILFDKKNLSLHLISEQEWITTLDILEKNQDYEQMWQLAKKAPPFWSQKLLNILNVDIFSKDKAEYNQILKLKNFALSCKEESIELLNDIYLLDKTSPYISNRAKIIKVINDANDTLSSLVYVENPKDIYCYDKYDYDLKPETICIKNLISKNYLYLTGHKSVINCFEINEKSDLLVAGTSEYTGKKQEMRPDNGWSIEDALTGDYWRDEELLSEDREFREKWKKEHPPKSFYWKGGEVIVWQISSEKTLFKLNDHTGDITCLAISGEGKVLASGSKDKTVKIWDLISGENILTLDNFANSINSVKLNYNGTVLASYENNNKEVKVWELPSGNQIATLKHENYSHAMVMNSDGTLLISADGSLIRIWELPSGKNIVNLTNHVESVNHLAINENATILISASSDKTIRLWSLPLGINFHTIEEKELTIRSLAVNNQGNSFVYVVDNDKQSWDSKIYLNIYNLNNLYLLSRASIKDVLSQTDWIIDNLNRKDITENQGNWLKFILELVNYHRRFEIDVEDAPIINEAGEFDIEIEG